MKFKDFHDTLEDYLSETSDVTYGDMWLQVAEVMEFIRNAGFFPGLGYEPSGWVAWAFLLEDPTDGGVSDVYSISGNFSNPLVAVKALLKVIKEDIEKIQAVMNEREKINEFIEKFTCQGLTPTLSCDGIKWKAEVETFAEAGMIESLGYTKLEAIQGLYMYAKNQYLISEEKKDGETEYEEEFWQ